MIVAVVSIYALNASKEPAHLKATPPLEESLFSPTPCKKYSTQPLQTKNTSLKA